ncbi:hypothetical protein Hanom_Chr07g00639961 [Helianthus anomalus]
MTCLVSYHYKGRVNIGSIYVLKFPILSNIYKITTLQLKYLPNVTITDSYTIQRDPQSSSTTYAIKSKGTHKQDSGYFNDSEKLSEPINWRKSRNVSTVISDSFTRVLAEAFQLLLSKFLHIFRRKNLDIPDTIYKCPAHVTH